MHNNHITGLNEDELAKGLLPLLSHQHWAYFEEYLRREQHKQVKTLSSNDSHVELSRAQGRFEAYQRLALLKEQIKR